MQNKEANHIAAYNNDAQPLVSVIIATYNDNPVYVRESFDSVLNQTYKNIEVIVIDDSTDVKVKAAIDAYCSESRVSVFRDENKIGFVPALNRGLELAKGTYIARMDADDVAKIDRIEKQVRYLESHLQTDVLGGQINIINEKGEITGRRKYPLGGAKLSLFSLVRTPVAHPSVMFRRRIVDAGHRYDASFKKAEDIDFWLRLYNAGYKFANIEDTILDFRVESDFLEKRVTNHEQEQYVLRARRKNCSWKRPLFSILDYVLSYVREWTPDLLKQMKYKSENEDSHT